MTAVEMLNSRKVICHEYAYKRYAKSKRNLPSPLSSRCVVLTNEYAPVCNTKMINIDLNEFRHSLPAKNTNLEIQIEYFTEIDLVMIPNIITACPPIPHTPCPRTKFTQAKMWQLMHNKTHTEYFYSITVV